MRVTFIVQHNTSFISRELEHLLTKHIHRGVGVQQSDELGWVRIDGYGRGGGVKLVVRERFLLEFIEEHTLKIQSSFNQFAPRLGGNRVGW